MQIGDYLQSLRANENLTLRQIENAIGISNAYLSQLENGKILKPSANVLYKLSKILKGDFDYMLKITGVITSGEMEPARKVFFDSITDHEERLLRDFLTYLRSIK